MSFLRILGQLLEMVIGFDPFILPPPLQALRAYAGYAGIVGKREKSIFFSLFDAKAAEAK
ncbi:MAG: hypothetical protein LBD40_00320 [Puniceicoccales bacterium]|nr:hypothetical protein [Puniceicoccales bacterium]